MLPNVCGYRARKERRNGIADLVILGKMRVFKSPFTPQEPTGHDSAFATETIPIWKGLNAGALTGSKVSMLVRMYKAGVKVRGYRVRRPKWVEPSIVLVVYGLGSCAIAIALA